MSGFVTRTISRDDALSLLSERMAFPWDIPVRRDVPIIEAIGSALGADIRASSPSPPFNRSLRDGFAVRSGDLPGASPASPVFLSICGEVPMGDMPTFRVSREEAAVVHTGGAIPEGTDAVIMTEDTSSTGSILEVRKSVQSGENMVFRGEEFEEGDTILKKGDILDFRNIASLAASGFDKVVIADLKVAIISTGDEIVPVETREIRPGMIRDSNSSGILASLARAGFKGEIIGIVRDDPFKLGSVFNDTIGKFDVVVLSGGSSISVRDHSTRLLGSLAKGEIPVRGLNISPGKPTIASGDPDRKKMAICLPGHPLSCAVITETFLVPLLSAMMTGKARDMFRKVSLKASTDIVGKSGVEEFIPAMVDSEGGIVPLWGKSGYLLALGRSDGLLRLPEDVETLRKGENVEVWLW